ncbi:MAG: hypothetical protein F6K26_21730 [Moorea sp. SIO2I5]|nr:hypothetical protein [Moorena sp. SIO2I5]
MGGWYSKGNREQGTGNRGWGAGRWGDGEMRRWGDGTFNCLTPTPDSRLPFPSWEGLGVGSDSRLPTPDSRLHITY